MAQAADSETIKDQLGPLKRAKLEAILARNAAEWSHEEFHFLLRCIREAHESFE